ncbi:PREDICTED: uncharacterized protein LOC109580930 isoform X1 [Amphimedon queenslandica]|uniref:EXPERA domain-containing protein n=1 Tax=Amphimedon queenslandica TaxID=400682 RepID=A0A1X7V9W3_AMPQE|nr:PREDICTED: uncharacterized protein LOC109580930 isoform X1 [Amphimedon queenslandica]|eukprot:XP_019850083.1 PREDICTED: uncharacterized protein LOC109580930 isoform X1 [Amphimedon queenslandica]
MASLLYRPLDLVIVIILGSFLAIGLTIDYIQTFYGSIQSEDDIVYGVWPPPPVLKSYAWWCSNVDTLLAVNPSWYSVMAAFSPFIYCPFYVAAIYAFIFEKEWIRIPALMWGWGLLLTMIIVAHEQLYGPHPAKDVTLFFIAYGAYAVMPLVIMGRVAMTPLFPKLTQIKPPSPQQRSGGKKKKN